jgi:hypothetical protein
VDVGVGLGPLPEGPDHREAMGSPFREYPKALKL